MSRIVIGVTDCSKYDAYASWIAHGDPRVETVKISHKDDSLKLIDKCQAIVLTGGEDVHPKFYNKPEYYDYCYKDDINEQRDELEFNVLEYSQKHRLPVLGICRGLQVANVFFGGTLIPDIPAFGKFNHSKRNGKDTYHPIDVDPNSVFRQVVGTDSGEINSAHHQSAEIVAPALVSNALSRDGVIEGLEWKNPDGKPFLLLVQWHPERMVDQTNPFAINIRKAFLRHLAAID
ncbi:MAG TPA: gamma-glutamyl-gamma-aminobutyrate hydrolase family protein [Chryseosolibacter sp.]|nr:gamma-glutamyl-gamma-aminobutyrate hydrolase family protein [Chryseosolibacter sp.]